MALGQTAGEDTRWPVPRAGERLFMHLVKGDREMSEQLQSPAVHRTLASAGGEAAAAGVAGCQDPRASGTQACVKVNVNQLRRAHILQREGCPSARLLPSAVSENADFIFAFYELERGNSFPWYNRTLWRKSCPNTFCSQILSWKRGRAGMKQMIKV